MVKFVTANEAARLIPDDAIVGLAGMGLSGWPEEIACAIRDSFKETGHPRNLNIKQGSAMGDWGYGNGFIGWDKSPIKGIPDTEHGARGVTRFGEAGPGLVSKWTSAHIGSAFALNKQVNAGQVDCHCLPQGVIINLWREIAACRPGLITKTGLGTFVDPRVEGGRMNGVGDESEELVKLIEFDGEEYLFYRAFKPDIALLRGTIADENGNISFRHESVVNEGFSVAAAVKNHGGKVFVQVEYLAKAESLDPKEIIIPGNLVDYVVLAQDPKSCWQAEGVYWEPSYSGQIKKPLSKIDPLPMDERKIILRRCAMELHKGDTINMGVGMPAEMGKIVNEEGMTSEVTMSTESGMIGGVPSALPSFGSAYNPECIITPNSMFDFISGGGLDVTVLGIGEIDKDGNNNVSRMGSRLTGPGGFIDISAATETVIFAGTLVGKAEYLIEGGEIHIIKEGYLRKFVDKVGQITFAGQYAKKDQRVLYITERAVFELIDHVLTLIEIAPGIDLERDVLAQMDFRPAISPELRLMPREIFYEQWGGLRRLMESKGNC